MWGDNGIGGGSEREAGCLGDGLVRDAPATGHQRGALLTLCLFFFSVPTAFVRKDSFPAAYDRRAFAMMPKISSTTSCPALPGSLR
jgi:hypothetical protein